MVKSENNGKNKEEKKTFLRVFIHNGPNGPVLF
jgi:hypothetical protein